MRFTQRWWVWAAWCVMGALVVGNTFRVFATDIKPELYLAPVQALRDWRSAWQATPQLGFPSFNVGLAPVAVVTTALDLVGFTPWLIVRVLRLGLLTLGAWGAACLAGEVVVRPRPHARFLAALVFVANPYTVVAGGTLAILWPMALLPWLALFSYRSLSRGAGWRWPAAAALVWFCCTGMNAGVVPVMQWIGVLPFAILAALRFGLSWAQAGRALARFAVLALGLSLYWLVPTLSAVSAGTTVVDNSETQEGIFAVSAWSEVLRGLGLWPLYGRDERGPWLGGQSVYLTSIAGVVASYAWTLMVAAAFVAAKGRLKAWLGIGILAVAVVMVGRYPFDDPSPLGRLLGWLLDTVPGLGALRTTNKAGAALVLCAAVLVAAGWTAWRTGHGRRRLAAGGVAIASAASVLPWFAGAMYTSPMPIPAYWEQAAAQIDAAGGSGRVWFIPGEVLSAYRWSVDRPDELGNSLFDRPTVIRTVIPVTSPGAANLLAAVDQRLQNGITSPGELSAFARRIGASDVLVRNDTEWEDVGGAAPHVVHDAAGRDPGLEPAGVFGAPGENTVSAAADPRDAALPPLGWYRVAEAVDPVRLTTADGTVGVVGDGEGMLQAMSAGVLPEAAPLVYTAGSQGDAELTRRLEGAARIVLTDSNRRRDVSARLTNGVGPLLPASEPAATRALGTARDQTTLQVEGGSATASQSGGAFARLPYAAPENAADHDPTTAWWFGDFKTAAGQWLELRSDDPMRLDEVRVATTTMGSVAIKSLQLVAAGRTVSAEVDDQGIATFRLPGQSARTALLTITATQGEGFNLVGIAEVQVPGLRLTRVARLPQVPDAVAAVASDRPTDILLRRSRGVAEGAPAYDEEQGLERTWRQPASKEYRLYGLLRATSHVPEREFDRLEGVTGPYRASSTSRAFDLSGVRASRAADDDPSTSWLPGGSAVGESVTVTGPQRTIEEVEFVQPDVGEPDTSQVTSIEVSVDGVSKGTYSVGPGRSVVRVDPSSGQSVTTTIRAASGTGPVRVIEAHDPGAVLRFDATRAAEECIQAGMIDGQQLWVRPSQPVTSLGPTLMTTCPAHATVRVTVGETRLSGASDWVWDDLILRDVTGEDVHVPTQHAASVSGSTVQRTIGVPATSSVTILSTGESYDPRWRATVDGRDLGRPLLVDGWAAGWALPAGDARTVEVSYGPQRWANAAALASLATLVVCLALLRRAPGHRPGPVHCSQYREAQAGPVTLVVAALVGGFVGGVGGVLAVVLSLLVLRWLSPIATQWAGVACLAAMPVAFVLGNLTRWGTVTPELVTGNRWPVWWALAGLALLGCGAAAERGRLWQTGRTGRG